MRESRETLLKPRILTLFFKKFSGKWSPCNATCSAKSGQKLRDVTCQDRQTNLPSTDCNSERKPLGIRRCHHKKLCPDEKIGKFLHILVEKCQLRDAVNNIDSYT